MGARVAELTWEEVERALAGGSVAVLPIGAAAKEHGRHLPLATDWLTAEHLAAELARTDDVLVWPTVAYGHYPAFLDYPGSTSVSRGAFERVVRDVVGDLRRAGARRVLVLDTGISTIAPVDAAVSGNEGVSAVHVYRGARYLEAKARLCEQPRGGHADEAETSVMLVVAPALVRMDAAEPWAAREVRAPFRRRDADHPGYAPAGHFGDPTVATADKGAALLAAMLEDLREGLR